MATVCIAALSVLCWAALLAPQASQAAQAAAPAPIRGLNPDFASKYTGANGVFTCLDGSRKIPFDRVNDDYCDCPDGSDEPGTPACYNGRLYCRNLGHEPKLLSTSFVDDGICDCCDGSDEPKGVCKNTCLQQGAEHREALRREVGTFKAALDSKANRVREAQQKLATYHTRKGTIHKEVEEQQAALEKLKAEKEAEEAESARQAAEAAKQADELAQKEAADAEAAAAAAAAGSGQAEAGAEPAADHQPQEDGALPHHEETDEERGRRIASQWTNDPEAAAVSGEGHEVNEDHGDHGYGHEHDHEHDHHDHDHEHDHHDHEAPEDPSFDGSTAASRYYAAQAKLRKLESEREKIERLTTGSWDFGPGDVFMDWVDRCFTSTGTRWTYEACPWKDAVQSEGYSNRVTVGRWKGWGNGYTEMVFEDGDFCEAIRGGRSFRVKMRCGTTEELKDAEEPGTCQYTAVLTSPLLCTDADLAAVEAKLAAVLKQEEEIAAKIAAAEAGHDEL